MIKTCFIFAMLSVATIPASCAGFNGVFVGQDASTLPACMGNPTLTAGGFCGSVFMLAHIKEGKVTEVLVAYAGPGVSVPQQVTLAQAVRLHSLQPGLVVPRFGTNAGGSLLMADLANHIAYKIEGPWSPQSLVNTVSYEDPSGDDIYSLIASSHPLTDEQTKSLLDAARQATVKNVPSSTTAEQPYKTADFEQAANPQDALDKLREQGDIVKGKGRMTLALIQRVSTWYEVDKNHPHAVEDSAQLRVFHRQFANECKKWDSIYQANRRLFVTRDDGGQQLLDLLKEQNGLMEDVSSKLRQLQAMGFTLGAKPNDDPAPPSTQPTVPAPTGRVAPASPLIEDCPAKILDARTWLPWSNDIKIRVENTTDKDIAAVKIRVFLIDKVGDEQPVGYDYVLENIGKHTKKTRYAKEDLYRGYPGAKAWPLKVAFKDGTTWENDTTQCLYTHPYHK